MATETNTRGDWKPEPVVSTGTYAEQQHATGALSDEELLKEAGRIYAGRLMGELAAAYEALGLEEDRSVFLCTHIFRLREQLAEARKAAAWQEITPENLPKKGAVLFMRLREAEAVSVGIATVDWKLFTVRDDYEQLFINPPAPEGSKP
jgi:hypothetical protein